METSAYIIPGGDSWYSLQEVIKLWDDGCVNAARQKWSCLAEEFRLAVLKFAVAILQDPESVASCPHVHMESLWGEFDLSPDRLNALGRVVPELN